MVSADILCARSMEVEWEDGTGVRQSWSSWTDELENGWHQAAKLLPSSVTDISVHFKIRGVGGPWNVCEVDRRCKRAWVTTKEGEHKTDVIWLRRRRCDAHDVIDAVFELSGPAHACHISRAWNASGSGVHRAWEWWEDEETQPACDDAPAILEAADGAAPISVGLGNPQLYHRCALKRVCAAIAKLQEVHRQTLAGLRVIDARFTGQWVGTNLGNTTSAGLGIASAVFLFLVPPVGVGLGIGSAVTGGITFAGDSLADRAHMAMLRKQLATDAWNSFAAAELLRQWMEARQALGEEAGALPKLVMMGGSTGAGESAQGAGEAFDTTLAATAVAESAGATATHIVGRIVETARPVAVAATQVFGIAGALISTGFAVRGWSSSKFGQSAVRSKLAELTMRVAYIQHLLAVLDRLECPLCSEDVRVTDTVRRCAFGLHCFHAACLQRYHRGHGGCCPVCPSPLEADADVLASTTQKVARRRRLPSAAICGCA